MRTWCRPVEADAAFVAALEDVVATYHRPPDPRFPLVCFDESGKELRADTRPPLPATPRRGDRPGQPIREDSAFVRHGSACLHLWVAPHLGVRHVAVTAQRTRVEWARLMRELVDVHFPDAERVVVLDNLGTHTPGALYATFPPAEARRGLARLELHFTPKHGSWLNVAECELSVLARQCLTRRLADAATLRAEVLAWASRRNAAQVGVDWQLTAPAARTKLKRLYPVPLFAE